MESLSTFVGMVEQPSIDEPTKAEDNNKTITIMIPKCFDNLMITPLRVIIALLPVDLSYNRMLSFQASWTYVNATVYPWVF